MAGAQQPQGGGGPCAARAAGWRCPSCRELGLFPLLRVGRFDAMPFPSYLNLVEKIFFFFRKLITGRVFRAALDGGISRVSTASSARAVLGFPRSLQRTEPLKRQNPLNPQAAQGPAVSVESPVEDSVLLTGFISSQDLTYISKAGDTTPQHSELGPLQVYVVGKILCLVGKCICLRDGCTLQPPFLGCFHCDFLRQHWLLQNRCSMSAQHRFLTDLWGSCCC